ncbi:MAG: hypothetical protein AAFY07_09685, partial [Pseudomonadota bacterium]
ETTYIRNNKRLARKTGVLRDIPGLKSGRFPKIPTYKSGLKRGNCAIFPNRPTRSPHSEIGPKIGVSFRARNGVRSRVRLWMCFIN